jgi:valyl-tRNA synthetase
MGLEKRYKPKESEPRWQKFWEDEGIFRFDHDDRERPLYSVDTPPPTVSGTIHMGHVFSYVQAEALTRFWRQRGYNVFYPFGFDDNGLPTERYVEKKLKVRAANMPRAEFIDLCLKTTQEIEAKFKTLWQSLGFSADWSLEYSTIDERSQRISQRSFIDLLGKDLAYRKETPALWCPECRTAVAQAEEEDVERETLFSDIPFELADGGRLVIATTRPELLPSCVCVLVHPDDERNKHLIGKEARVPLFGQTVPILAADDVDMEKGTGVVMCCTFGDTKDIEWWERYDLPLVMSIDRRGRMTDQAGEYDGQKVAEARKAILQDLEAAGLILAQKKHTQMVNTHERCGTPIEFIVAHQWFIKVLDYRDKLIEAGNKMRWFPSNMKVRYDHWVENLHWDWGVSRQRFYGVPIPVWLCTKCDGHVPAREEDLPVDPQVSDPPGPCPSCGSSELTPERDVLDTWATSSVTPQINVKWGEREGDISDRLMPMSMRPQAHDIIRTWAFYTTVKSIHHHGDIPWNDVVISGHVVDAERKKISKSKLEHGKQSALSKVFGHPEKVIDRFSADPIRYWACRANLGVDTAYDEKMIELGKRFVTKLWNASKFALSHLEDWDGSPGEPTSVDRGLLARLAEVEKRATKHLLEYEIGGAVRDIESFFWSILCDNYLEMVKARLYEPETYGEASKRGGQATLHRVLLDILKMLAPFMPHVTEEIYQQGFRERVGEVSIHVSRWPDGEDLAEHADIEAFDSAVDVITAVRKYKSENNLSMGSELTALVVGVDLSVKPIYESFLAELRSTARAKEIRFGRAPGEATEKSEAGVPLWIER